MLDDYQSHIRKAIAEAYGPEAAGVLEFRRVPRGKGGDVSLVTQSLARLLKIKPNVLATNLAEKTRGIPEIERVDVDGVYVNFHFDRSQFTGKLCRSIQDGSFFTFDDGKGKTVVFEHTSINPNASPHVGRARNAMIGDSLVRILRALGYSLEVHYYINDMGKQIAMLVNACRDREKLSFDELLQIYVDASLRAETDPSVESEAIALLDRFEQGDAVVREEFRRVVDLCVTGQVSVLNRIGIHYDKFDRESDFNEASQIEPVLLKLQELGAVFTDPDGRQVVDLRKIGFNPGHGEHLVLRRSNGSSMYVLRDLAYTIYKGSLGAEINLTVLGEDHRLYHEQLKAVLTATVGCQVPEVIHYSFVMLREGKMSTRKGTVVLLADFLDQATANAAERVVERNPELEPAVVSKLSEQIAVGAIKYAILHVSPSNNVTFDLSEALNFEGGTGPYIQYASTRTQSIAPTWKEGFRPCRSSGAD